MALKPSPNILGIDLGGTKIALRKYDHKDLVMLSEETIPTKSSADQEEFLKELVVFIQKHLDQETQALGLGVPGPTLNGVISKLPNIPQVHDLNLKEELLTRLEKPSLPVSIQNDANCFVAGAWKKTCPDLKNVLGITLGTGVGGGLIIDGQLLTGRDGIAGEFGHMLLRDGKTFQELCSGKALTTRWQESTGEKLSGEDITQKAEQGDQPAQAFLEEVGRDLGIGVGNLLMAFNPERVLIGGSVSKAYQYLKKGVEQTIHEFRYPTASQIEISILQETDYATFGAAWLASSQKNSP